MYFFRGIPNHLALLASVRSDTFIYFICATSFHNKVLLLSALQTRLRRRTFGTNTCVCDCAVRQSSPPPCYLTAPYLALVSAEINNYMYVTSTLNVLCHMNSKSATICCTRGHSFITYAQIPGFQTHPHTNKYAQIMTSL